jgi:hypothetical protein
MHPIDCGFDDLISAAVRDPGSVEWLESARQDASSLRERQIVAIAAAFLAGEYDRVDVLARDHLADHPDSVVVAQIAAATVRRRPPAGQNGDSL